MILRVLRLSAIIHQISRKILRSDQPCWIGLDWIGLGWVELS